MDLNDIVLCQIRKDRRRAGYLYSEGSLTMGVVKDPICKEAVSSQYEDDTLRDGRRTTTSHLLVPVTDPQVFTSVISFYLPLLSVPGVHQY